MGMRYEDLEEMCHTLGEKLSEANDKIRATNGDLTGGDLEFVDRLTHAIKSIKTTMAMMDAEEYSYDGMSGNRSGYNSGRNGNSGRSYRGGRSYARGRGRYANRDSMGRYSGADQNEEIVEQLREIMQDAPDDQTRKEFEKMITKLESM